MVRKDGNIQVEETNEAGETIQKQAIGGKGTYKKGQITLNKNTNLSIYVGGQNGYNGGGEASDTYGRGGGASDIRMGGTTTSNRILVAGGGGGAYAEPEYHQHVNKCYTTKIEACNASVSLTGSWTGGDIGDLKDWVLRGSCGKCGQGYEIHQSTDTSNPYIITCTGTTTKRIKVCGKEEGVDVDSYTCLDGNTTAESNGTAYQGAIGGGGGYNGGTGRNAGTSYTSTAFSEITTTEGAREGNGYVKITLVKSYPEVSVKANSTSYTNQNLVLTATAKDDVVGLKEAPYSWNGGARTSANTYTISKNGTYHVNVINQQGMTETVSIEINNIDKIAPVVNSIDQAISTNKKQTTLTVHATDTANADYVASGVVGYAITTTNTAPVASAFQSSNTFTVNKNGIYYAWAKDRAGNISTINGNNPSGENTSQGSSIRVKNLEINVLGNISWNDQNNKYSSRKNTTMHIYRKVGTNGTETKIKDITIVAGETTSYSFQTRECDDNGNRYIYRIAQDYVAGYETVYTGNEVTSNNTQNVSINITNNLILPTYTSKIEYNLIDGFRGEYLKNTKLEMVATIEASKDNREKTGVNTSTAVYVIDEGFTIDKNSITVTYIDGVTGKETRIEDYTVQRNNIVVEYGVGENHVTKAGDKLSIRVQGEFAQIKQYHNSITLTGKLTDYKGTNTNIELGNITKTEKNFEVRYQKPKANIQIRKRDSITEEKLTEATFTLYEWDGSKYVEKEILRDDNKDGIYTSKYYEWKETSQGKYKVVETGIPVNHKDLNFSMEYTLDQLKTQDYTVSPDYSNGNYRIAYGVRNPDDFDRENGVVENEPYKIKVSIDNRDSETKKVIQSNAVYTIYEWDKTQNRYVEYVSKTNGKKVEMARGTNKIYTSDQWLYYTANNEGKYKVVETTAAAGYYGDYERNEEGQHKREYMFNIVDIVNSGNYEGQTVGNESTIQLRNNTISNTIENTRQKTEVTIQLIDKETRNHITQGDGSFKAVEYEIYAKEQINHADGITTRHPGQVGVLYQKDELVKVIVSDENGVILETQLECGKYYVKQKVAAQGYVKDNNTYELDISYRGQNQTKVEVNKTYENTIKKQAFQILKQQYNRDDETIPLANAGFSIYQIKDLSIVKAGKITKNQDGSYTLNDEAAKEDSNLTGKANKNGTYKIGDLVDYYYKRVYTEETMQILPQGERGYYPYNLNGERKAINYANHPEGEVIQEQITGSNGYVKSPELAYGEYIVIETTVPHNKEAITPFVVTITTDSREAQSLKYVVDPDFESKIKIYTKDIGTKETIFKDNAKFVIKNTDTDELVTYKTWSILGGVIEYGSYEHPYQTNQKGYAITPNEIEVGNYELIQLKAPEGYVLNGYEGYSQDGEIIKAPKTSVKFEIGTNQMCYVDSELNSNVIITVEENKAQVGTLEVNVKGEKLTEVDKHEGSNPPQTYTFEYTKQNLKGVQVGLYAKEDIYTQDERKTIQYRKDQLIGTKTTNEEGIAHFDNIPIGKYYVKEIKSIYGFYTNEKVTDIEIVYGANKVEIEAQKTPVTKYASIERESERQKITIVITNIDKETGEPVVGQKIGIYAKEDIYDKEGNIVVGKDELIEIIETNENGKASTKADLPLSTYYAKEIEAAPGYTEDKTIIEIDATNPEGEDKDEDGKEIVEPEGDGFHSNKTSIYVKAIEEDGKTIVGSILQIVDEEGNIVEEWTSIEETKQIRKLKTGITYTLTQKVPMTGYVTIDEISFRIQKSGELEEQKSEEQNTLKPIHYTSKVEMHLIDKETKEELANVVFEIYKAIEETNQNEIAKGDQNRTNKTKKIGEKIGEFTTKETGSLVKKLPIGEYIIKQKEGQEELLQDKGYVQLLDKTIVVEDKKEVQRINLEQDYSKLEIEIFDKTSKKAIQGIKLEIYKEKGQENVEKVQEVITVEGQTIVERLPVGKYILKEVVGQKEVLYDKGYVTNEDIEFKVEDKVEIQRVTIEQQESRLEIDLKEEETVSGVTIQIINKETAEVVEEFTTGEDKKIIDKLPIGDYILHIKDVPYEEGYIRGEDIEITIEDSTKPQEVHLTQDYTKVEVSLLDIDTKEPVIGGTLVVTNKEGKEVTESWITNGKPHKIDKLPIGEYELVETMAPTLKGYVKTEKVTFEVKETGEVQPVEMLQDYTRVEIKPIDKETGEEIKDIELSIKDDKGNEVGKVTIGKDEDINHIINRLPVGDYIIESTKVPYGYKPIQVIITIKDKQGLQGGDDVKITLEREEFDLNVEAKVEEIRRNDKVEYKKKENTKEQKQEEHSNKKQQTHKVDIKDKKIKTEQIEVTYQIKVSNQKKITGQVGRVEVTVPAGMTFIASNNKTYWKEEGGKVVTEGLKGRDIKSGEKAEIPLVLNWKNGLENFGTKKIQVEIKEVTSDIGFKETNLENNKAVSEEIIIGVSTGEMNLVYLCWILLAVLILAEIYLSKKTKIKKFAIKDKTTKWRQ